MDKSQKALQAARDRAGKTVFVPARLQKYVKNVPDANQPQQQGQAAN